MVYTLTFDEDRFHRLVEHLFADTKTERAAYALCSLSSTENEKRLLVREIIPIHAEDLIASSETDIAIPQSSFLPVIQKAAVSKQCFVFFHSHPENYPDHSSQDDIEEPKLFRTVYNRAHNPGAVHASVVFSSPTKPVGRVWLESGETTPVSRVRVIGKRFLFYDSSDKHIDLSAFDRQVLAFGEEVQALLGRLSFGIVGLGGTGSALLEQSIRLGVGRIIVCDPQEFELSNINRVFGSGVINEGCRKTEIASSLVQSIGLPTRLDPYHGSITDLAIAEQFRECDVIFGCTDDEWGRAVLSRMALTYLIPVFDLGAMIDSKDGTIRGVHGRITTLIPHSACLMCRGIITSDAIAAEIKRRYYPEEYEQLRREGYARELPGSAPSVIMFTSTVASLALAELLHYLTGFMGQTRQSTQLLIGFDQSFISRNSQSPQPGCWCGDPTKWPEGDVEPFLNMTWVNPV